MRVVIFSIALGTLDRNSQTGADKLFWWAFEMPRGELEEFVRGLEGECLQRHKMKALEFGNAIVGAAGDELPFDVEPASERGAA